METAFGLHDIRLCFGFCPQWKLSLDVSPSDWKLLVSEIYQSCTVSMKVWAKVLGENHICTSEWVAKVAYFLYDLLCRTFKRRNVGNKWRIGRIFFRTAFALTTWTISLQAACTCFRTFVSTSVDKSGFSNGKPAINFAVVARKFQIQRNLENKPWSPWIFAFLIQ